MSPFIHGFLALVLGLHTLKFMIELFGLMWKNWVESEEGEIIPESVQNDAFIDNIAESKPINGNSRENQSGQHILKPSNYPSGDPFGLDDLIHHYEYEKVEALRESTTPQDSKKVKNGQTFHQVLEESVNKSSGVSITAHADSMAGPVKQGNGFSIIERFQEFIDIGQAMGLGGVKKKQWVTKLCHSNQVKFLSIRETKMVSLDVFVVKNLWGNMLFDFATSSARGRSGGILCVWDKLLFHKKRTYATEHCLCVEGVTALIAKFLILDIPIDSNSPIVVGWVFMRTIGGIVTTPKRLFSTFDGFCHQTFHAARSDIIRNAKSDSDDEEDYQIKRNKLREAGSDEEIFTSVAWIRAFNINEPIYVELCYEFYSTYKFDEVCVDDELLGIYQEIELEEEGFNVYFKGGLRNDEHFNAQDYGLSLSREENLGLSQSHTTTLENPILRVIYKMITYVLCQRTTEDVVRSLSALIYCRDLDTITFRDWIDSNGKLIPEDPQPGVPRVVRLSHSNARWSQDRRSSLSMAPESRRREIKVAIQLEYPEKTIEIGSTLMEDGQKELCSLLRHNLDIFAW
nr:RNA-directed DNA polymerase, eukaryota [Tanacetum cinerariifolium]